MYVFPVPGGPQKIGTPGQPVEIHMQRVRQLLVRIHDREFRYGRIAFVVQPLVHVVITCTYSKSLTFGGFGGFHIGSHGS